MEFVDKYYPYGFAKNEKARQVARLILKLFQLEHI